MFSSGVNYIERVTAIVKGGLFRSGIILTVELS